MAYQLKSTSDLVAEINSANASAIAEADLIFSTPVATNGSWRGLSTPRNTAIKITATEASIYQKSQTLLYDRLDLAALGNSKMLGGFKFYADSPKKVSDVLTSIRFYTGVRLSLDDVEDSAITDNGDKTYSVTLTAKAGSVGWIGQVTLTVLQGGIRLADKVTDTSLDGLNYPTESDGDTYGQLYLYGYDFTPYYADVQALVANGTLTAAQATALATDINAIDSGTGKGLWNTDAASTSWSLSGANVVFNGLNGSDKPTNPAYKYVLVLALRSDVATPKGNLYLHYNDPVDPNAV